MRCEKKTSTAVELIGDDKARCSRECWGKMRSHAAFRIWAQSVWRSRHTICTAYSGSTVRWSWDRLGLHDLKALDSIHTSGRSSSVYTLLRIRVLLNSHDRIRWKYWRKSNKTCSTCDRNNNERPDPHSCIMRKAFTSSTVIRLSYHPSIGTRAGQVRVRTRTHTRTRRTCTRTLLVLERCILEYQNQEHNHSCWHLCHRSGDIISAGSLSISQARCLVRVWWFLVWKERSTESAFL